MSCLPLLRLFVITTGLSHLPWIVYGKLILNMWFPGHYFIVLNWLNSEFLYFVFVLLSFVHLFCELNYSFLSTNEWLLKWVAMLGYALCHGKQSINVTLFDFIMISGFVFIYEYSNWYDHVINFLACRRFILSSLLTGITFILNQRALLMKTYRFNKGQIKHKDK